MSLLNVGARALLTNQIALQTTGNNIANVSTPGYSRQSAHLVTVPGQYSPQGYIGKGVAVETILRNHSELLTRQAALAGSAQAGDKVRSERLNQMQEIYSGGKDGLGTAISDMLGSLSDVLNSPTDMTARTVTLTRMAETAGRFRTAAERLSDIEYTVNEQLKNNVVKINNIAQSIAAVNGEIAAAQGNGQSPNDLLDQRDQLIRELNQYIQTSQIPADDGTVGVFVAGSQPLVMATTATELSLQVAKEFPGSGQMALYIQRQGTQVELNEQMLGGGEMQGLLRFANQDMAEGRNLLGRMAQAMGMTMNAQHKLGLTLDGQPGKDLFAVPTSVPGYSSSATAAGDVSFTDPTKFAASDYEVRFTSASTGVVVRLTDGTVTSFSSLTDTNLNNIDGLKFNLSGTPVDGDRMLFKPFASTAQTIEAKIYAPKDLAAANPINAAMGTSNSGSLQLEGLKATGIPALTLPTIGPPVTLSFDATGGFTVTNGGTPMDISTDPPTPITPTNPGPPPVYAYTSGQAINIDGWQITLKGTPNAGDTVTVGNALYTTNATLATATGSTLVLTGISIADSNGFKPTGAAGVTFNFTAPNAFTINGTTGTPLDVSTTPPTPIPGPPYSYAPGQAIQIDGWRVSLTGTPTAGDTVTVGINPSDAYKRNAGNGGALMALRDVKMFDNAALQDGWANAIAQVGTRTQSAQYATNMSTTIANNLERDRLAVSGVNLDEEAAKLIQYQQAYQASAKMLQVAQSIFDNLMQTVGR